MLRYLLQRASSIYVAPKRITEALVNGSSLNLIYHDTMYVRLLVT